MTQAYGRAGAPDAPALPVSASSDVEPLGSAGLVDQGTKGTVEQVGAEYGRITQAAVTAALGKREADSHGPTT